MPSFYKCLTQSLEHNSYSPTATNLKELALLPGWVPQRDQSDSDTILSLTWEGEGTRVVVTPGIHRDLMDELHEAVFSANRERWGALPEAEQHRRAEAIAQGGLRYFLLKNNPARTIIFDKKNSISVEGDTGPYCQYAYARCSAILGKVGGDIEGVVPDWSALSEEHARRVLTALLALPDMHQKAVVALDPSLVAKGLYDLAQAFSSFYAAPAGAGRVVGSPPGVAAARVALVRATQTALGASLGLLGIPVLEEM